MLCVLTGPGSSFSYLNSRVKQLGTLSSEPSPQGWTPLTVVGPGNTRRGRWKRKVWYFDGTAGGHGRSVLAGRIWSMTDAGAENHWNEWSLVTAPAKVKPGKVSASLLRAFSKK